MTYYTNLTQFLDENVRTYPNRNAIIDGETVLSFRDLRERAIKLASLVSKKLTGNTKRVVAVFVPRGVDSITADIAVSYSGNTYMNLDIKHPEQRFRNIFESVHPDLLITQRDIAGKILDIATEKENIPVIYIDDIDSMPALEKERENALLALRDHCLDIDLLCIINTSGSTGTPKGVALNHRGFIDLVQSEVNAQLLDDRLDVIACLAPLVFDHHSFEICLMMMRASTLLIIPESFAAFPIRMLELMAKHQASFLFWVPTIMVNIANMDLLSKISLPSLRKVWFAGEVFPTAKFNYWRRHLPQAQFVNLYGPTEISVDCTYYVVKRELKDDEPIPIGQALPNTEVFLLDEQNNIAAPGEEGEICVRGVCLSMGYYNNQEKTDAAFVQNPLNRTYPERLYRTGDIGILNDRGEILFRGRRDTLIKHMGYRIELGEIENVILGMLNNVRNCCVTYQHEEKKIVLFYEASEPIDDRELRERIGAILPRYMVPHIYRHIREMPRNNNGKIDRLKLRQSIEQDEKLLATECQS